METSNIYYFNYSSLGYTLIKCKNNAVGFVLSVCIAGEQIQSFLYIRQVLDQIAAECKNLKFYLCILKIPFKSPELIIGKSTEFHGHL